MTFTQIFERFRDWLNAHSLYAFAVAGRKVDMNVEEFTRLFLAPEVYKLLEELPKPSPCVWVVGSVEDHFIADQVYNDFEQAVKYCNSRANDKYTWIVKEAPFGATWLSWRTVHTTARLSTSHPAKPVSVDNF